jgi:hypothetical protein
MSEVEKEPRVTFQQVAAAFGVFRLICAFAEGDKVLLLLRTCKLVHAYTRRMKDTRFFSERIRAGLKSMPLLQKAMDDDRSVLSGSFLLQLILGIPIGSDPRWSNGGDMDIYYAMQASYKSDNDEDDGPDDTITEQRDRRYIDMIMVPRIRRHIDRHHMTKINSLDVQNMDPYEAAGNIGLLSVETFDTEGNVYTPTNNGNRDSDPDTDDDNAVWDVSRAKEEVDFVPDVFRVRRLQLIGVKDPHAHVQHQFDFPFLKNTWSNGKLVMHFASDLAFRTYSHYSLFDAKTSSSDQGMINQKARSRILRYLNRGFVPSSETRGISWKHIEHHDRTSLAPPLFALVILPDKARYFVKHPPRKALPPEAINSVTDPFTFTESKGEFKTPPDLSMTASDEHEWVYSDLGPWCMTRLFDGATTRKQLGEYFGNALTEQVLCIPKHYKHCKFCDALGIRGKASLTASERQRRARTLRHKRRRQKTHNVPSSDPSDDSGDTTTTGDLKLSASSKTHRDGLCSSPNSSDASDAWEGFDSNGSDDEEVQRLMQCAVCAGWVCHRAKCRRFKFNISAPACLDCIEPDTEQGKALAQFVDDSNSTASMGCTDTSLPIGGTRCVRDALSLPPS